MAEDIKTSVSDDSDKKITTQDVYRTLWRCRDFELSHLWQRSVFLSAFLVLCFTGYGVVIMNFDDKEFVAGGTNSLAIVLCVVGFVFSCMWVMMGKGSKAWYERYERAIVAFSENEKYMTKEAARIGGFNYQEIDHYEKPEQNNCLLSGKGGAFSPSKINIAVGQVSMILWILAFMFHAYVALADCFSVNPNVVVPIIGVFVIVAFLILVRCRWMHSGALSD